LNDNNPNNHKRKKSEQDDGCIDNFKEEEFYWGVWKKKYCFFFEYIVLGKGENEG
jgi:hypothetical protein